MNEATSRRDTIPSTTLVFAVTHTNRWIPGEESASTTTRNGVARVHVQHLPSLFTPPGPPAVPSSWIPDAPPVPMLPPPGLP
eukprot:4071333-Pyramimonas_sp.AAC.1